MSNQNRRSTRNSKRKLEVDVSIQATQSICKYIVYRLFQVIHPLSTQLLNSSIEELPDLNKFDPLTKIPDIFPHKYIFKYLSFQDIINLSETSKSWYKVTASSQTCMKKVKVKIDCSKESSKGETPPSPVEFKILRNSIRNYQYIDFSCQHNQIFSEECLKIINFNRSTLVELTVQEMSDMGINSIGDILLPNLKVLKIKGTINLKDNGQND